MEVPGCPSLNCENCPDGLIKTDAPVDRKTGCQIGCGTCECPPQPMCMPPENYVSHTPPHTGYQRLYYRMWNICNGPGVSPCTKMCSTKM